jgi:glucose 1-dehydrogenase
MLALTVEPGVPDSMQVEEIPDPQPEPNELLVNGLSIGVCGTDREIAHGDYGAAPPGRQRLVIGHESLGRVAQAAPGSGFSEGDLVVGVVRRPDPVPCGACARGEFDMCRNGRYTERGIKSIHGYASERWVVDPDYAIGVDADLETVGTLLEPTSVVAKAWEQVYRVGERGWFDPRRVLVTGAGPIGLLAALLGVQRGLEVNVLDRVTSGPKPRLVESLGAAYHHDPSDVVAARLRPDVIIEATGSTTVVIDAMCATDRYGIVCLTGVSPAGRKLHVDAGALNRDIVLENDAVIGSVNANLRHYRQAADALARADVKWLQNLITRRVPLAKASEAFHNNVDDVKVVIDIERA